MKTYFKILAVILLAVFIFVLHKVFIGVWILPQSLNLGFISIRYYGLCLAVAAAAGIWYALKRAKDYHLDAQQAEDILFWVIVGGFVGARLYHVITSGSFYFYHPLQILEVWKGGLSIYGVILGGVTSLIIIRQSLNLQSSIFNLLDWLAPSLILGQIIGRLGNFFNYELFGYPTNLPWKMFVPAQFRPEMYEPRSFFHPLFLYEMIWNTAVLGILIYVSKKAGKTLKSGTLFFLYLLLYNVGRFFLEFIRIDSVWWAGIRVNATASFALAMVSLVFLAVQYKHGRVS